MGYTFDKFKNLFKSAGNESESVTNDSACADGSCGCGSQNQKHESCFLMTQGIDWVDVFISRVREYIFVRAEDNLLIKRPNQAHKLNPQGVQLLGRLLDGESFGPVSREITGGDRDRLHQILHFIWDVKTQLEGKLTENNASEATEVKPFHMGFTSLPVLSEVAVTYRCNLKCQFCYAGCNCTTNPIGDDREMSTEEIKEVLRRIRFDAQTPSVSFTGGEPTLRPELPEFIAYAKEIGMRVNLISNGQRITESYAKTLADAGLDSCQISLEGVTAAIHERLTAIPGSFPRTINAVKNLQKAGVLTHTNTTLTRTNLMECREIPRFIKEELGHKKFSMNLVIPTGTAALDAGLVVPYKEVGEHLEAINAASEAEGVEFMWYSPTPMCMFNPIVHGLGNKGCSACDGLISVGANGDVLPCASYDESVGNILTDGFESVWNSQAALGHRDKALAHPQCRECENFHICNGGCPLYWRKVGFGELVETNGFRPVEFGTETSMEAKL